jgi:tetratricopeptide (TPR) repeat protein
VGEDPLALRSRICLYVLLNISFGLRWLGPGPDLLTEGDQSRIMGHALRISAFVAALALCALPVAAFDGSTQSTGGVKKTGPAAKPGEDKTDPAAAEKDKAAAEAQRILDAGVKAYEAGKFDPAIRAFSASMRVGLSNQQIAKALYYRGLAYRKTGKPGLAISDLTSAVWLKDGLSAAEKQEALKNRAAAYKESGIANVPAAPVSLPGAEEASQTGWQTALNGSPQHGPASTAPSPEGAPVTPTAPVADAAPSSSSSGGGIGGFFNSITSFFGGGSSSTSAPNADDGAVTTASLANAQPGPPPSAPPVVANWNETTEVAASSPPPPAPVASPPPPPAQVASPFVTRVATAPQAAPVAEPKSNVASGKYRLQVAAVRSRSEAYALSVRLISQYGSQLGGRQPAVDEAVIGSMGTFYRVRLGPYASAKEPQELCGTLQASGFDCLVVTE